MLNFSELKKTIKSVAYALLGVQSNANRKRDFSQGKLSYFIVVGLLAVVTFIAVLIAVVSLVLS